jgi:hypothetical protein
VPISKIGFFVVAFQGPAVVVLAADRPGGARGPQQLAQERAFESVDPVQPADHARPAPRTPVGWPRCACASRRDTPAPLRRPPGPGASGEACGHWFPSRQAAPRCPIRRGRTGEARSAQVRPLPNTVRLRNPTRAEIPAICGFLRIASSTRACISSLGSRVPLANSAPGQWLSAPGQWLRERV